MLSVMRGRMIKICAQMIKRMASLQKNMHFYKGMYTFLVMAMYIRSKNPSKNKNLKK